MKFTIKGTLSAVSLAAFLVASLVAPASADNSGQSLKGAVQSAISTGNVNLSLDNGVVTLFGWVENAHTKQTVKRVVLSFDGVTSVIDLISISN